VSTSQFVCWKCGNPVYGYKGGWKHALGGRTGKLLRPRRPVPIRREDYELFSAPGTPLNVSRRIARDMAMRELIQGNPPAK
jgi:hypothetical protein